MQTIHIHGASDDLVEIDGKVEGCDEYGFYTSPAAAGYIATSDGSVFRIAYSLDNSGCWRVGQEHAGTATVTVIQTGDDEADHSIYPGARPYSDVVKVEGELQWVKFCGKSRAAAYKAIGQAASAL